VHHDAIKFFLTFFLGQKHPDLGAMRGGGGRFAMPWFPHLATLRSTQKLNLEILPAPKQVKE
jgi:hypothetical protein